MYKHILEIQFLLGIFVRITLADGSNDNPVCAVPYFTTEKIGFGQYLDTIDEDIESLPLFDQLNSLLLSSFSISYDVHDNLFIPAFEVPAPTDPDDDEEDIFGQSVQVTDLAGRLATYYIAETSGDYTFSIDDADDGGALMIVNDSTHMCCQNANLDPVSYPKAFYIPEDPKHSNSPLKLHLAEGQPILIVLLFMNSEGGASFSFSMTLPSGEIITNFEATVGFPSSIDCNNVHSTVVITAQWTETSTATSISLNTIYSSPVTVETTYYVMTPTSSQSYVVSSSAEPSSIGPSSAEPSSIESSSAEPSTITSSTRSSGGSSSVTSSAVTSSTRSSVGSSSFSSSVVSSYISSVEFSSTTSSLESEIPSIIEPSINSTVLSSSGSLTEILPSSKSFLDVSSSLSLSSSLLLSSSLSLSSIPYTSAVTSLTYFPSSPLSTSSSYYSSQNTAVQTVYSSKISRSCTSGFTTQSRTISLISSNCNDVCKTTTNNEETYKSIVKISSTSVITRTIVPNSSASTTPHQTTRTITQTVINFQSENSLSTSGVLFSSNQKSDAVILKSNLKNDETSSYTVIQSSNPNQTGNNGKLFFTAEYITGSMDTSTFESHATSIMGTQYTFPVEFSPNSSSRVRKGGIIYMLIIVSVLCLLCIS